jgi:hypothetical protein
VLVFMPPALIGAGHSAIEYRLNGRVVLAGSVATENCLERPNALANAFRTYRIYCGYCGRPSLIA